PQARVGDDEEHARLLDVAVRVAEAAEKLGPARLEVRQVVRVVDDPHAVDLAVAHADRRLVDHRGEGYRPPRSAAGNAAEGARRSPAGPLGAQIAADNDARARRRPYAARVDSHRDASTTRPPTRRDPLVAALLGWVVPGLG